MTRQSPPIVPERGVPLTAETVGLLQPGDWLLRRDGRVTRLELELDGGLSGVYLDGSTHANSPASHFTFLGRPDADGWIAHDGEVKGAADGSAGLFDFIMADGREYLAQKQPNFWHGVSKWRPHVAAAPREPEGGAVKGPGDYTMVLTEPQAFEAFPALASHIERMAVGRSVGSLIEWDAFLHELNAALTPKAAPAADDDGPCTCCDDTGITIQTERPCACSAGIPFEAPAATGAGEPWAAYARAICESEGKDWTALDNSREDCQRWFQSGRACAALRAQPQAREEAQPVAWRYRYPKDEAWQLTQDHEQAFKNTGEVEPLGVIPSPPSQPLAEGTAAEKLREVMSDLTSWFTKPVQGQRGLVWVIPAGDLGADDAVSAALAALQQEGR